MSDLTIIWQEVVEVMGLSLNHLQLQMWIHPLKPISLSNDCLVLDATSAYISNVIQKRYLPEIEECLSFLCKKPIRVQLTDPSKDDYNACIHRVTYEDSGQSVFHAAPPEDHPPAVETPQIAERILREKSRDAQLRSNNGYNTLNPKYTMESFVSGPSNEFAFAAARGVIKNPGTSYNPFFIYGGSGLGKTHLMQAIAHEILREDPTKKVLYTTSEKFMNEMIKMIENGTNAEKENFRRKYRAIDVILIDDIQFIAGKKATMEEVFHTFNDLKEANKQIVLSSDKPPKELKNLEERLVTRFEGGMTADIQPPDFETRVAILNHKAKQDAIALPESVIRLIASQITSNIRELEGAFLRVGAFLQLKTPAPDALSEAEVLAIARDALNIDDRSERVIRVEEIIDLVTETYGLQKGDLASKSRQSAITWPRQIAMYLARRLTSLSLVAIGEYFNRDHTTVMHAVDKISEPESTMPKPEYQEEVESLAHQLRGE